jgi:hypothetical protein
MGVAGAALLVPAVVRITPPEMLATFSPAITPRFRGDAHLSCCLRQGDNPSGRLDFDASSSLYLESWVNPTSACLHLRHSSCNPDCTEGDVERPEVLLRSLEFERVLP